MFMLFSKNSFVILATCLTIGISSFAAHDSTEERSFHCENTGDCNSSAKLCGQIAGIIDGRMNCQMKAQIPHSDFVWQNEVKAIHCMGYLPIGHTLNNDVLQKLFINAYQGAFTESYKAAGCQVK